MGSSDEDGVTLYFKPRAPDPEAEAMLEEAAKRIMAHGPVLMRVQPVLLRAQLPPDDADSSAFVDSVRRELDGALDEIDGHARVFLDEDAPAAARNAAFAWLVGHKVVKWGEP